MKRAVEKTKVWEGINPSREKAGLFSRQELESLVKGLAGPSWDKWMGDPVRADQKLSILSNEDLEKILTKMLEEMC